MLLPRTRAWTRRQKTAILFGGVLGLAALSSAIYAYERWYRGPSESALVGVWQDTLPALDTITYYRFKADGTFDIIIDGLGEISVFTTGTWYAGGHNIYWRLPAELVGQRRPLIWHIDDVSSNEIRVRSFKDGAVDIWKRVDDPLPPQASNQAMQRTASKAATDALRVCHPRFGCESRFSGLAVADLVSR